MGPEASNGVTESMGLMADLALPAGPDPLIDPELAALAPSSWDLATPANGDPGAQFVMVADVSRQLLCCSGGSSIEAQSDTTERASAIEAVWRSVWRTSRVWDRSQTFTGIGSPLGIFLCELCEQTTDVPSSNAIVATPFKFGCRCRAQQGFARFAPGPLSSSMAPYDSLTTTNLMV